jgi:nucleoside-diphosphate-sugar epimerase
LVGSFLVEQLIDAGAEVTVLDDFSRGKNKVESPRVRYAQDDAGDPNKCVEWFHGADVVFNLAAFVAGIVFFCLVGAAIGRWHSSAETVFTAEPED